jgi:hypothetical protein
MFRELAEKEDCFSSRCKTNGPGTRAQVKLPNAHHAEFGAGTDIIHGRNACLCRDVNSLPAGPYRTLPVTPTPRKCVVRRGSDRSPAREIA